jgi:hypothetical protein
MTQSAWDDFQEAVDTIKQEISLPGAKPEVEKIETPRVGYLYQAKISQGGYFVYFSVDGRSDSEDIFEWKELSYSIDIGYPDGTKDSSHDGFTTKSEVPDIVFWVIRAFHKFVLKARKIDLDSLFGDSEMRILGFPGMDHHTLLTSLLVGAVTEDGFPPSVIRFRHVNTQGPHISVRFSYAVFASMTWVVFPDIAGLSGGSSHGAFVSIEKAIAKLSPGVETRHFDYGEKEFMAYFARNAHYLGYAWDLADKHEGSIDFYLGIVALSKEIESKFQAELKKINDDVWNGEYPEALRDQRVLVQDALQELMRRRGLPFKPESRIGQLAGALIDKGYLEGRLRSWFEAYPAFANASAHQIYPTKKDMEDEVVRSRTSVTLWLGKHLLYEVFLALRDSDPNLPKPVDLGEVFGRGQGQGDGDDDED